MRTVKQWNRLPQKLVQFPSSEVFKIQLDNVLSNLAWPDLRAGSTSRRRWAEGSPEVPSNLN